MPIRDFQLVLVVMSSSLVSLLILLVSIDETSPAARACASSTLEERTLRWLGRRLIRILLSSAPHAEEHSSDKVARK